MPTNVWQVLDRKFIPYTGNGNSGSWFEKLVKSHYKGQLISKCLFGAIDQQKFLRISALASKKRSNK